LSYAEREYFGRSQSDPYLGFKLRNRSKGVGRGKEGGRFDQISVEFRCREEEEETKRGRRGQEEDKKRTRRGQEEGKKRARRGCASS